MADLTRSFRSFFLVFILLFTANGLAMAGEINASIWGGLAIKGADPVAYFADGKFVEGSSDFSTEWKGATWHFSSAQNLSAFKANPDAYAPQYGGFCAYAVSRGYTAKIDPEAWTVVDGKLYLNYSKSVQKTWSQDIPGNVTKGNVNWPSLRAGL